MQKDNKIPIQIWIAIAKNNKIQMFTKCPKRGKTSWIGEYYINSMVYNSIKDMIKNSSMNWNCEPEFLELAFIEQ